MEKLTFIGRYFFSAAIIALGIEHLIFEDFVTGRAPPWPESVPGRFLWAYLTGVMLILISLAIIFGKKARSAAIFAGTLIFLWALLRHIPILVSDTFLSGSWTSAGKALTFFGAYFSIAATFPKIAEKRSSYLYTFLNLEKEFIYLGRLCLGIFLIITGIQHFLFTEFVASLIPEWFPGDAEFWTWFAGVALIAGGAGLFINKTAFYAAFLSGIMVFSWFWIVHIPRTFLSQSDNIAVFEALAVSGIAFVLAGYLSKTRKKQDRNISREKIPFV